MCEKEVLQKLLSDLHDLLEKNVKPSGEVQLDFVRAKTVLEFAKSEIEKTIPLENS